MSLPDFRTSARHVKPWHHVGHRILRPFTGAVGDSRCFRCGEMATPRTEARFEGRVYAHKQWCPKCGRVITYGVYNQQIDPALGARARAWAVQREDPKG